MKYAIIGCGRIARKHIEAAHQCGLTVAAVCDISNEAMHSLISNTIKYARPPARYLDYKQMLKDIAPQIVAVATDSGSHAEIALNCINAGANVILEKPMAMSLHDARNIINAADERMVKVTVCHQNRFNYASQALYRAIRQNRFGKLSHASIQVRWNRNKDYYRQATWRGHWQSDGGALLNQCIHGIDLLRWLMGGSVKRVYGVSRNRFHPYIEAEDIGIAVIEFSNGAVATVEGSNNIFPANLEETLCIFGEKGTVKLGGKAAERIEHWCFADGQPPPQISENIETVYGNGHARLYADMLRAIAENRCPFVDARAGKNALEMVLAIYKSQKEGRVVELPLSDFSSTDMAGEFSER